MNILYLLNNFLKNSAKLKFKVIKYYKINHKNIFYNFQQWTSNCHVFENINGWAISVLPLGTCQRQQKVKTANNWLQKL